jgi:hypothetical protein
MTAAGSRTHGPIDSPAAQDPAAEFDGSDPLHPRSKLRPILTVRWWLGLKSPARDLRSCCIALAVLIAIAFFLISQSPARRVGDGAEYMGMAYAISTGHSPALSPVEWNATNKYLDSFTATSAFPGSLQKYPVFQNAAHGQDYAHFWMYSALAAPGVALSRLLGLNANWSFVLLNLLLYLLAAWLALRRLGLAGTWFLFLSPVIWWLDKAVTETFTFSLLSIAFLLLEDAPWWSLVCLGFAADQNPPIALIIPVLVVAALLRDRSLLRDRRMWIGTVAAVLIAILHPIFYETQLGVITPESLTTVHWQIPSLAIVLAPITDLNMGLLVDFPLFIVGLVLATGLVVRRRWRDLVTPETGAAIAAAIIFLLSFAQNTQINTGGTPSLNRYDLWLVPLLIPVFLICFRQDPRRMFRWFMPVAVLSSALSLAAYQPSKAENPAGTIPSRLASYVWAHYPGLDNPVPGVFFAREAHSGVETISPVGTPTCSKILLIDGDSSYKCRLGRLPPGACMRTATTLCYANAPQPETASRTGRGYSFAVWSGPPGDPTVHPELLSAAAELQLAAAWCKAAPEDTRAQVYSLMGPPHGSEWTPWAVALAKRSGKSAPYAEWDVGYDILVATFENGKVSSLNAYSPIPHPAMDIHCQASRG